MEDLFQCIHFSPKGSSDIVKEEATYMLFLDFLDGCEKVTNDPSIGMYCTLAGITPCKCLYIQTTCCCCCCFLLNLQRLRTSNKFVSHMQKYEM